MIIDLFQIGEQEKDFAFELQPDEIELDEDTAADNRRPRDRRRQSDRTSPWKR